MLTVDKDALVKVEVIVDPKRKHLFLTNLEFLQPTDFQLFPKNI